MAFIAFFSWASHLGLNQIVVRELTKYPEKKDEILGSAFFMKLCGALVSVGLISMSISFVKPDDSLIRWIVFVVSLTYIFQAFDVLEFYFQAKVRSKYAAIAKSVALILASLLKIYFILENFSVEYFAIANVMDMLIAGVVMTVFYKKIGFNIKNWKYNATMAKSLIKYSWPLMISAFLISIHMKLDQLMIEYYLDLNAVGLYSVSTILAASWYFIPAMIASTLMPYYIELREKNYHLYELRFLQLLSIMFWIGVCVGVLITLVGQQVIVLFFGDEYAGAYVALVFSIWGGIFIAQGFISGIWQIAEELQIYRLYIQVMAVLVNVGLNILFIPKLGISGAAISTFFTYFMATWIFGLLFKKTRRINIMMIKSSYPLYALQLIKEKVYERFL